ncbi:hypothetical protein [Paenibacillus ihumii]|uniref:hypothetical protein n=1 Tax=Paenibacillus ihumii TaxID=687436 RepID=UPI0006D7C250|nr:hypothetical protein [Paenibacillus ihumii]
MTASIAIVAEEWMMTAGLIGLTRMFSSKEEYPIVQTNKGIELNENHLKLFPERYIRWMIREFSIVERDLKRMEWPIQQAVRAANRALENPSLINEVNAKVKESVKDIRKIMNEQISKVQKYFPDSKECHKLLGLLDSLKLISNYNELNTIYDLIDEYKSLMSEPFINEKLTLNYVKAVIMGPFFGQTSILQPIFNSKTTEQHIEQLNKDFVLPAICELQLHKELNRPHMELSTIIDLLQDYADEYKPFKDWHRSIKKIKHVEEVQDYFQSQILPCSLVEGLYATQSYEEMTFSPLALSKKNAVNFNWNFNKGTPVPISAVARLILFAVPLGLAAYNRRLGTEEFNENKRFFGMILSQKSFVDIVKDNNHYRTLRSGGTSLGEAIVGVLDEAKSKAERKQPSYLFIELHSEYQMKKTLLDYYHMPGYLATYLDHYGNGLKLIHHSYQREAFLRAILRGLDPKATIYELLRLAVKPSNTNEQARLMESTRFASSAYYAVKARFRVLQAKKGAEKVSKFDWKIQQVYEQGVYLRNRLISSRPGEEGEGRVYQASGRKKLDGIIYRLLNSAKTGNKSEFMDTLFRIYLSANTSSARQSTAKSYIGVPQFFVDSFKEEGLDFDTIATAFIAGLLGQQNSNAQKAESGEAGLSESMGEVAINE